MILPAQFAELEKFAGAWSLASEEERIHKRVNSSMAEIQEFYEAVRPKAEAALAYLSTCTPDNFQSDEAKGLFELMLSFAEASLCVENFRNPTVVDGFDVRKLRICHEDARA